MRTRYWALGLLCLWTLLGLAPKHSYASLVELTLGPGGAGNGGTNPIGIPPSPVDAEFTYITDSDIEINVSVIPGITAGKRYQYEMLFGSLGGGLLVSASGIGIGGYAGFGLNTSKDGLGFIAEYKQTIGWGDGYIMNPYALRLGVAYAF